MPTRLLRAFVAGAALLTAACGSDSTTSPGTPQSLDLGAVLAEIGRGIPAAARGDMGASAAAGASPIVPSTCSYVSATQSFSCPSQTASGLTITVSYTLLDAAGHAQSAPDPATTASVRTVSTVKGTMPLSALSAITITLDRTDDMTLSGLLTGVHTLNGTGAGTSETVTTINGLTTHVSSTDRSVTSNVVLPKSGSSAPWPVSGTVTSDQTVVSSTGNLTGLTSTIHTVMTFNGSGNMTVTITIDGHTINCTINLSNPASACS